MTPRTKPCATCGLPRGKGSRQELCTRCYREERTGEVAMMLGAGRAPEAIARAYGVRQNSLARSMWRLGRPDLARRIETWDERPNRKRAA
jgi:hypothetical protein